MTDKRKQSLYFPMNMLREIADQATRLDRSMSWIIQRAWHIARHEIARIPSDAPTQDAHEALG